MDIPYPPIQVDGPNRIYAREMPSNMSDVVSEMSDVSRYFYISVVAGKKHSWTSKCFHHISIVEMHNLNMFAELALLLGADPRLWCDWTRKHYWSPGYLSYPRELRALIAESIKAEEMVICKYTEHAYTISDRSIVKVLNRIILDEERHLQIFREMYKQM